MAGIRIDELSKTVLPSPEHEFPAMKDGMSVKLTIAQIVQVAVQMGLVSEDDLGDAAFLNVGTTSGTVAAGDDSRITGALQKSGGTMTGKITLDAGPTSDLHAATKKYVDDLALGVGQTWQDVLASRETGTSYQNTTGKPIQVAINAANGSGGGIQVSANGTTWVDAPASSTVSSAQRVSGNVVVPNGHYYRLQGLTTIHSWSELR